MKRKKDRDKDVVLKKLLETYNIPANQEIGGSLGLDGLTSIPEGFNPTVGGDLWLRGLTSIPEGFNPTVGGSLWLDCLTKKQNLSGPQREQLRHAIIENEKKVNAVVVTDRFVFADRRKIYYSVVRKVDGIDYYRGIFKGKNVAIDKDGIVAHGKDLKSCLRGIARKKAKEIGLSQYEGLTLESKVKHDDAIIMYQLITRACDGGVDSFVEKNSTKIKDEYTVAEIISLVGSEWGSFAFRDFFSKGVPDDNQ